MSSRTLPSSSVLSSEVSSIGDAAAVTLLLRDWESFGLSERVCYHFDLTETLTAPPSSIKDLAEVSTRPKHETVTSHTYDSVCGVAGLLDCVPTTPWSKLTKRQKRILRGAVRDFNRTSDKVLNQERTVPCFEPKELPLRLTPSTRLLFGYQVTRIAFVLDASPTLTTAFQTGGGSSTSNDDLISSKFTTMCALDRLPQMARSFFTSLVNPIESSSFIPESGPWQPRLAVSVIAVYPRKNQSRSRNRYGIVAVDADEDDIDIDMSVLVRDACVYDKASAEFLANSIEEWALEEVESEIACRVSRNQTQREGGSVVGGSFDDTWTIPLYVSSLEDLLCAGDASLSIMSSQARPCIVVATDGRSVDCSSSILGLLLDDDEKGERRSDIPLIVLDLSSPESHRQAVNSTAAMGKSHDASNFLTDDPGCVFPLHLTDDTEALYAICRATGGCFFDEQLLKTASVTVAGTVDAESPLSADRFFAFKRLTFRPNAVQWYTLFSLSPLSPTFQSLWGRLVPPQYLRQQFTDPDGSQSFREATTDKRLSTSRSTVRLDISRQASQGSASSESQRKTTRTTLSAYMVSPIRIKGLLLLRVKEGYRAKQYWQSTQDGDKVFMEFALYLENGTVLHYDLSYKPQLEHQSPLIGRAQVKIELSGDHSFVQSVKNDFLSRAPRGRAVTISNRESARLCEVLRWIRKEDCLQSYICPVQWGDKLSSPDTPFVRRLGTLTRQQQFLHFRFDEFDIVCRGNVLSEFFDVDNGEQSLLDTLSAWSTQTIQDQKLYVKKTNCCDPYLSSYCVLELSRSSFASRLFTIAVKSFGGSCALDRLTLLDSLKRELQALQDLEVLPKQMSQYLVGVRNTKPTKRQKLLESHHLHETWDLVNDPELLPLLTKRRTEIGKFRLLHSSDDYALFANLISGSGISADSPMELFQYQIAILSDKVVIDVHMECESGKFFPFRFIKAEESRGISRFHRIVRTIKRRDQECGRALQARTSLLQAFTPDATSKADDTQLACVKILLPYSSRMSRKFRFFGEGAGSANIALLSFLEGFMISNAFGMVRVVNLSIVPSSDDFGNVSDGIWFLIQFDLSTMSIVHVGLMDQIDQGGKTFREITFFTSSISDLYSTRYEGADDDSTDDHVSEYVFISEFADTVETIHQKCFAAAAYLALLDDSSVVNFQPDDFAEILRICDFVEVAGVLVEGESNDYDHAFSEVRGSSLFRMIETTLRPVPGDDCCFYYSGCIPKQEEILEESYGAFLDDEDHETSSDSDGQESQTQDTSDDAVRDFSLCGPFELERVWSSIIFPIFVRFSIDGNPATIHDLTKLSRNVRLAAQISLFKRDESPFVGNHKRTMPWSHNYVAAELRSILDSYVAEQTIEILRHVQNIEDVDLSLVKRCLRKARNVVSSVIDMQFYLSKTNTMAHASMLANSDTDMESIFSLFLRELQGSQTIQLKLVAKETFVVVPFSDSEHSLDYWAFVDVKKRLGAVSVDVYHPAGLEMASMVTSRLRDFVLLVCRRVNQLLLLERLHRSRIASSLLIPEDEPKDSSAELPLADKASNESDMFKAGSFQCPVVFSTSFRLYHRCAANPFQVALSLQSTVLHSFAVSNRRDVFVYKDETGSIFYLLLRATAGESEVDGKVELHVHGVQQPGPSVTQQLKRLLQKRVLLIAVDMLSTVLAKNPNFKWASGDVELLRSFEAEWGSIEEQDSIPQIDAYRLYEFPAQDVDPLLVLLMFRQNFCGSTFFHRLYEASAETDTTYLSGDVSTGEEGTEIKFDDREFRFYYNNTPSKLNPSYQAVSTLTSKGVALKSKAGTGMALIELSLVFDPTETAVQKLRIGEGDVTRSVPRACLRFAQVAPASAKLPTKPNSLPFVAVRITDTALNRAALHDWVELTLNQSLVAWNIERHLQRCQEPAFRSLSVNWCGRNEHFMDEKRLEIVNCLVPGLPALVDMLETSYNLPHPAIEKVELVGVIRASSVAATTLDMLESCILGVLSIGPKMLELLQASTIRLSRSMAPQRVKLAWVSSSRDRTAQVIASDSEAQIISDAPIDCPEYICSFWFCLHDQTNEDVRFLPMLFSEVLVDDGISDKNASQFTQTLEALKKSRPSTFRHSFGFIFSVKRNRRSLLAYNWDPQILSKVVVRLREKDNTLLAAAGRSMYERQLRCLKLLSPQSLNFKGRPSETLGSVSDVGQFTPMPSNVQKVENDPPQGVDHTDGDEPGISRKVQRPLAIRRPKLIGKSVEGAAMQAVAASRARASTNRFRGNVPSTAPSATSTRKAQPGGNVSILDPSTDSLTTSSASFKQDNVDDSLIKLRREYELNMLNSAFSRRSILHVHVIRNLTNIWWPTSLGSPASLNMLDFLLSQSVLTWSDVCHLPVVPGTLVKAFLHSFAQWVGGQNTGLQLVRPRLRSQDLSLERQDLSLECQPAVLAGVVRRVRSCKCFAVARISWQQSGQLASLHCDGFVLTLPRKSKTRCERGSAQLERDSAGLEKVAMDLHSTLLLDVLACEFISSFIEEAMKLNTHTQEEFIPVLRELVRRQSLTRPYHRSIHNYHVFEANIILDSYRDKFINMFDAPILFQALVSDPESFDLMKCGSAGLCFKQEVKIRGCRSTCFLIEAEPVGSRMKLVILSWTGGKSMSEYIFRDKSNEAITLLDATAIEAAGLAYSALKAAATNMRRDILWNTFRASEGMAVEKPLQVESIDSLAELTSIIPVADQLKRILDYDSFVWSEFFSLMEHDSLFSLPCSFQTADSLQYLFYLRSENVFLRIRFDIDGDMTDASLILHPNQTSPNALHITLQRLSNYLLHFIWTAL